MTSREYYDKAIAFMSTVDYVCEESIALIADLYGTPIDVVREDVRRARHEKD